MTRIERVREALDHDRRELDPRWRAEAAGDDWAPHQALYLVSDIAVLVEAADAVIGFCDLEMGYKGGALTEAAKKLLEEVE